jgi:hypothetical protein
MTMLSSLWTNMAPSLWVDYWGMGVDGKRNDGFMSLEIYLYSIVL